MDWNMIDWQSVKSHAINLISIIARTDGGVYIAGSDGQVFFSKNTITWEKREIIWA